MRLIVVGASLGGLQALSTLLGGLDDSLRAAIAVVQHRRADSPDGMAQRLQEGLSIPVSEPNDQDQILPGRVYLAPAGYHLMIDGDRFSLSVDEPVQFARPSIDVLFESAVQAHGSATIGILLTAASHDGAAGIKAVADAGGITIVQDPTTARSPVAVEEALKRTKVDHICKVEQIPGLLKRILR